MQREREEIRADLLAIMNASRELSPDADGHLADIFLDQLDRDPRRGGRVARRSPVRSPGARVVLAALAVALIVLLPVIMWSNSHTTPEPVYQAAWLVVIGLAGVAVVVMAYAAVRERAHRGV